MTTLVDGGAVPVGVTLPFCGVIANIPDGFLLCDGSQVNRNTYAELFAALGTQWGTGNGATTFNIPTTQGLTLRGQANGTLTYDPDANSRVGLNGGPNGDNVGSFQNDRIQSHLHQSYILTNGNWGNSNLNGEINSQGVNSLNNVVANRLATSGGTASEGNGRGYFLNGNSNTHNSQASGRLQTTNNGGGQTAPNNVAVNYIIKF